MEQQQQQNHEETERTGENKTKTNPPKNEQSLGKSQNKL